MAFTAGETSISTPCPGQDDFEICKDPATEKRMPIKFPDGIHSFDWSAREYKSGRPRKKCRANKNVKKTPKRFDRS